MQNPSGSSLEQESLLFHTALLWLPHGSTSVAVINVDSQGCSLESSESAPAAVTFWKGVELHFSSNCRREKKMKSSNSLLEMRFFFLFFFPSSGTEDVSQAEEITLPMAKNSLGPCQSLTLVPVISQWEL